MVGDFLISSTHMAGIDKEHKRKCASELQDVLQFSKTYAVKGFPCLLEYQMGDFRKPGDFPLMLCFLAAE